MCTFSSPGTISTLPPSAANLPLGDLSRNPLMYSLFEDFKTYMANTARGQLYQDVKANWLDTIIPVAPDTPSLLLAIKTSIIGGGLRSRDGLVGLYLFVAWYFLVSQPGLDATRFSPRIKAHIREKCKSWEYKAGSNTVKVNDSFMWDPAILAVEKYTSHFNNWLSLTATLKGHQLPHNLEIGDDNFYVGTSPLSSSVLGTAKFNFVKCFRDFFQDILREEFQDLLLNIGPELGAAAVRIHTYAVGAGGDSVGFFGQTNLGLSFFGYKGVDMVGNFFPAFDAQTSQLIDVWSRGEQSTGVVTSFAALGIDPNGHADATVFFDSAPSLTLKASGSIDPYFQVEAGGTPTGYTYDPVGGLVAGDDAGIGCIQLELSVPAAANPEEAAILIVSYVPFPASLNQQFQKQHLRIDFLFNDNDFILPKDKWEVFWTDTATHRDALKSIIFGLRDSPNPRIEGFIEGKGVGERVDILWDELQSDVVSAANQFDDPNADREAINNQGLRYAYGEVSWSDTSGVGGPVLCLQTEGYCSPVRCTWSSWPFFQKNTTDEFLNKKKAAELMTDIGFCLNSAPDTLDAGTDPSYNIALSAFRAMGMMVAMVERLKKCTLDLAPELHQPPGLWTDPLTQLSKDQAQIIIGKLNDFLENHAKCDLVQVGQVATKRLAGVVIDYEMYQKYAEVRPEPE